MVGSYGRAKISRKTRNDRSRLQVTGLRKELLEIVMKSGVQEAHRMGVLYCLIATYVRWPEWPGNRHRLCTLGR